VTGHISRLERIQRMGAQAIIGAFRTVSSGVLQDEAGLKAVETRLARKTAKHTLEVRALPQQHPLWAIMNDMGARNDKCKSPLFATWSRYREVIEGKKGIVCTLHVHILYHHGMNCATLHLCTMRWRLGERTGGSCRAPDNINCITPMPLYEMGGPAYPW
jgi:hypothetical protein